MNLSRRDVLKTAALTGLTGITGGCASMGGNVTQVKRIPIGLQLFAVRGEFAKDIEGTLENVAQLGYEGVEFWGYRGGDYVYQDKTAEEFRTLLDRYGLRCAGMHLNLNTIVGEALDQTIAINKTLGNPYLIVAMAKKEMSSPESVIRLAQTFNQAAERAAQQKMRVGYHCHGFDFVKFEDLTAWDLLFSLTRRDVIMQLDMGNCASGGGKPIEILRKFPNRATTVHIKAFKEGPIEPDNEIWQEILQLCQTTQGTRWYIVEMGGPQGMGFEEPRKTLMALKQMVV